MTKRGVVTLCAMDTHGHDCTSEKTNRSKANLSNLGLNTFKLSRKILMGIMKTKNGA
jgi:hypothetical protein